MPLSRYNIFHEIIQVQNFSCHYPSTTFFNLIVFHAIIQLHLFSCHYPSTTCFNLITFHTIIQEQHFSWHYPGTTFLKLRTRLRLVILVSLSLQIFKKKKPRKHLIWLLKSSAFLDVNVRNKLKLYISCFFLRIKWFLQVVSQFNF